MAITRRDIFVNNASTTLTTDITAVQLSIPVVDSSVFPTPTADEKFAITLSNLALGYVEVCYVTNNDTGTNTLTVAARGEEAIAGVAGVGLAFPSAGTTVDARLTAEQIARFMQVGDTTPITPGSSLTVDSAGRVIEATASGCVVNTYDTPGTADWTKPANAQFVEVYVTAAGGGGGSGRKGLGGSNRSGGGGGEGGGRSHGIFLADDLGATVEYTVGAGGAGGAAQTTSSTDGVNGTPGGLSRFGTAASPLVQALGGDNGNGGTTASGAAGSAASSGDIFWAGTGSNAWGVNGGAGNDQIPTVGGTASADYWGVQSLGGGGGGGHNGGVYSSGSNSAEMGTAYAAYPGLRGVGGTVDTGTGATLTSPTAGGNLRGSLGIGGGGGGGGFEQAGAAGGAPGGGGGGGGAGTDGVADSGAGGAGGDGVVVVITWF